MKRIFMFLPKILFDTGPTSPQTFQKGQLESGLLMHLAVWLLENFTSDSSVCLDLGKFHSVKRFI